MHVNELSMCALCDMGQGECEERADSARPCMASATRRPTCNDASPKDVDDHGLEMVASSNEETRHAQSVNETTTEQGRAASKQRESHTATHEYARRITRGLERVPSAQTGWS